MNIEMFRCFLVFRLQTRISKACSVFTHSTVIKVRMDEYWFVNYLQYLTNNIMSLVESLDSSLYCNLVDPASSHMLVSKIKPCMFKYKLLYGETANSSVKQL
jgi:hypothetical protein